MPDQRRAHGAKYSIIDRARTRPKQHSAGRIYRCDYWRINRHLDINSDSYEIVQQRAVVSRQLSVVSCQLSVASCQLSV
ncbi:MAG: hypothetical protein ABI882_09500, partial [Acidobacteriota bacterium]